MKHVPPPGRPDEPPWMASFRAIEDRITEQVDRYVRLRRRDHAIWFFAGMGGYWVGVVIVEAIRWGLSK